MKPFSSLIKTVHNDCLLYGNKVSVKDKATYSVQSTCGKPHGFCSCGTSIQTINIALKDAG